MKRNVYVLVDETKNEFIGAQIANGNEDICIQLKNAMQKESQDVKISCYRVQCIQLDDDNNFSFPASKNPDSIIPPIWCSVDEKTVNEKQLKDIISEEVDNEHLQ